MRTGHILWGGFGLLLLLAMFDSSVREEVPPSRAGDDSDALIADASFDDDIAALAVQDDWTGGNVTLERQADGHFYARPLIGSSEIEAMVDTGASFVALTGEDARRIGLFWDASQLQPVARGASGIVEGVPITLERVELGSHVAYQVPAAIIPEGLPITLLGQSFLSRIDKVEIIDDKMVLGGI